MSAKQETFEYYKKIFKMEADNYRQLEARLETASYEEFEYLLEILPIQEKILCSLGAMLEELQQELEQDQPDP